MDLLSLVSALSLSACPSAPQATLELLDPPAGTTFFAPTGVDYDGNTISGNAGGPGGVHAARWVEGDGVSLLPFPSSTTTIPQSTGISASGNVIVGNYLDSGSLAAFRWTPELGSQRIDPLPSSIPAIRANAVSADGRVIVGGVTTAMTPSVPFEVYRWTATGSFDLLPVPGAGSFSIQGTAVDANGSRVGGEVNQIPMGVDGFVFEDGQAPVSLRATSGSAFHEVDSFSADGSTLVGNATNGANQASRPILWTASGGVEDIPLPGPSASYARFLSVSGDGALVVGRYADLTTSEFHTFVWQRGATASQDLGALLTAQGVPGASRLQFSSIAHVSTDGRVIAGLARRRPDFEPVAYRVVLSPPSGASLSTTFCSIQPANSVGGIASLDAVGTDEVLLNALELQAAGLPPGTLGYFLASATTTSGTNPAGSVGSLCLGGNLRGLVMTVMRSDASGTVREFVDQDTLPGAMTVTAGTTMNFQGWYRDQGPTSRFTAAAAVTFR